MRSALVTALVARAENSPRSRLRRFLRGLSCDELEFIASFLGACILESCAEPHEIADFRMREFLSTRGAEDLELKMILLMEYLCRSGIRLTTIPSL